LTNRVSNVAQDVFDAITRFISSPPGQLAAGGVLAGIVWKFFERIEAILTEQTKLRIAVWLLGVEISKTVEPWPKTFVRIFDRVFGYKHFSVKCFFRSCLASCGAFTLCVAIAKSTGMSSVGAIFNLRGKRISVAHFSLWGFAVLLTLLLNMVPDYFSLLKTRIMLSFASKPSSG